MTRRLYTKAEDEIIIEMRSAGLSCLKIGRALQRHEDSVKNRHRFITLGNKPRTSPYPGCAALVRAQIATGQVQRQGLQEWVARHGASQQN